MASGLSGVERATVWSNVRGHLRAGRMRRGVGSLTAPIVIGALLAVWLISGVPIGDVAKFVAFEALYVVLPGSLVFLLLSPHRSVAGRGPLGVLAVGWPLGYALEIGGFALTAALDVRGVFAFIPLLIVVTVAPPVLYRNRRARLAPELAGGRPGDAGGSRLGVGPLLGAIAIATALVLLAVRTFAVYPLPGHAGSAFYFVDNVWDMAMSAEALHHWPIVSPYVAGLPLRYYVGVFIHVAALKQVTGVPVATAFLRLVPATSIVVVMLQFWYLGGLFGRSRWAGTGTVGFLIVLENMKFFPTHTKVFGVALFSEFTGSPTYGLGLIFLLGTLILFKTQLLDRHGTSSEMRGPGRIGAGALGSLLLLAILILGGGAMKTTAVATFVGGLGLFWVWRVLRRRADWLLSCSAAIALVCFLVMYFLMLSGSNAPAATLTKLAPLDFLKYTVFSSFIAAHSGTLPLLAAAAVIIPWKVLPVAGALWPLWRRQAWSSYAGLALAVFIVGFLVYVMLGSPASNESYFIWFGYIPIIPLAIVTLTVLWGEIPPEARAIIVRFGSLTLILGLASAGVTQVLSSTVGLSRVERALWYAAMLGIAGGLTLRLAWQLARELPSWQKALGVRIGTCAVVVLGVLGGADSIVLAVPDTWKTVTDRQTVMRNSPSQPGITAPLYRGLVWVRDHTHRCDVLAVGTPQFTPNGAETPRAYSEYFYYSAFTEREVFFESWIMTIQGQHGEQPFPGLFALNEEATVAGKPAAIRELMRRGVRYILLDRTHGAGGRGPGTMGHLVFANSALDVYRLVGPVGPHSC